MNCTEFNQNLDDYLSEELDQQVQITFLDHAAQCPGCSDELELARGLTADLRAMPVPPASADFAERVLRQAKQAPVNNDANSRTGGNATHHRSRGFAMGFSSALAAGVILWGVIALFPSLQDVSQPSFPVADVTIALDQTSEVNLVFETVAALENAKISIDLPSNIALVGYPELRHVEWRTNLVKGSNLLRLPVIATGLGQIQTLVAHIEYGEDKITTLKIKLAVKPKLTQQQLLDVTRA